MFRLIVLLVACTLSFSAHSKNIKKLESELNNKRYDQAAKTGMAMLRQQPNNIHARFLTAVALQENNQTDIAQKYYQQIIKKNPELPEPRNNLAMIYMDQGKYDEAINLLISSLKTHPAYATAWQNLNLLYEGLASEAYRKALSTEKNSRSVMDKIKLSSLTKLHSSSQQQNLASSATAENVQLASAAPAKKPVTLVQTTVKKQDNLIKPLQDWAQAWSQKKFDQYINAYSKHYKGDKPSHKAWVEHRRSRIMKPGSIKVRLTEIQIKSQNQSRAIIDFNQSFKSDTYADKVVKRIYLTKINDSWKITRERTIAVL